MILQRDTRLETLAYHISGCHLFFILFLVNKRVNYPFCPESLDRFYTVALKRGFIDREAFVIWPDGIFDYFNCPIRIKTDSTWRPGEPHKYPPDYQIQPGEYEEWVMRYYEGGQWHYHFLGAQPHGYDAWGCSKAARVGELRSKRIYVDTAA